MRSMVLGAVAAGLLIGSAAQAQEPAPVVAKPAASAEKLALAHQIIVASGGETQLRAKLVGFLGAASQLRADVIPTSARVTSDEIMAQI